MTGLPNETQAMITGLETRAANLTTELEKANDAYLGIKHDYTVARQAWHKTYGKEITTLRAKLEVAEAHVRNCHELLADAQSRAIPADEFMDLHNEITEELTGCGEFCDPLRKVAEQRDAAEKDKRTVMDDFQRVSALQVTELEELENELATLRKENQAARKALEIICPAEDGFTENFDLLADMGILVEVPADEVFKEEWASDTMWVWKWIAEAEKGGE